MDPNLLIDGLTSEDIELRLNSIRGLSTIARALGEERTRKELIPFLSEFIDEEDEVLIAIAEELGVFIPYVGGVRHAHVLLPPLETLCAVEETLVRNKAVESLCRIGAQMTETDILDFFIQVVKRLAFGEWFSRVSSCGLFHMSYPSATNPLKTELRTIYGQLCQDDMPMVRTAAASNLGKFAFTIEYTHLKTQIMSILDDLTMDDQDSVRLFAVESCAVFEKLLEPEDCVRHIVPMIVNLSQDKSWRVRVLVANQLYELCEAVGPEPTIAYLVPAYVRLLRDNEAEVRIAAAGKVTKFCKILSPQHAIQHILPCVKELSTDSSPQVRSALASVIIGMAPVLGKDATKKLLPIFLSLKNDEFPDVRLNIISKLDQLNQFYQDGLRESITPSKRTITSRASSGHTKASSSTHSSKYLSSAEPVAMTFQELHRITDGFSEKRFLGQGAFGMVYKGVLDNGEVIAVKKLHNKPGLVEGQFKNELLNLMTVKHQNIIRLVGYCSEANQIVDELEGKKALVYREERALCFEYLQGGDLYELLSDESSELEWEERYRIINGICQGLKHLHTGSKDPIYHLDLKPANILLDMNRIPKIGDFGLSRLLASTKTFVTKTFSGTTGYMPPEYMHGRQISSKFDVFSLGVIIIEIIAGREGFYNYKCLMSPQEFINHVTQKWSQRVQVKTISTEELLEVQKCIKMALRCVEDNQAKRPTITEIVEELNMISQYAPFDADAGDETTLAALSI